MKLVRPLVTAAVFLAVWWGITAFTPVPPYMLPAPQTVAVALYAQSGVLLPDALTTLIEILLGLLFGTLFGAVSALGVVFSPALQRWLMPLLVISQAVPVFALAPLLVLWLGFGMASKIVAAVLVIFFPVTAAFTDGLRRTEPGWLDLARTMGASPWSVLWRVRLPAALPAFASGLRVATATAPIGAVFGEWVGASSGLGYEMFYANARIQPDLMFAALLMLVMMTVALYMVVDAALRRALYWVKDV